MITLHIPKGSQEASILEEKLKDLVISYRLFEHEKEDIEKSFIEEDGKKYKTEDEIKEWLEGLEADLNAQRMMSGDGCYIKPGSNKAC